MPDPVNPTPIVAYSGEIPNPSNPATYGVHGRNLWAWEISVLLPGANTLAAQAYTNALAAQEAAQAAYINANFKGAWSGLTGALNMPAMVSHAGERWVLLVNLANVTTSTPGLANPDWELFELPAASSVGFDPTGTSRTATNVQDVLEDISEDADVALIDFENPVLNGDMRVAQTGTSFSVTAAARTPLIDGFNYGASSAAVLTAAQVALATPVNPKAKWLTLTVTTADAAVAALDYALVQAPIEGFDAEAYVGTTFTVGAWVKSSVTGVHGLALRNTGADRIYRAEINILAANTPQFVSITVVGGLPAAGTWNFTNGVGFYLEFILMAGSDRTGVVGSWTTDWTKVGPTAQVNALATIGNVFGITDVQINPGTVAKRFKRPTYEASLARCQRHREPVPYFMLDADLNGGKGSMGNMGFFKVEKASVPVLTASVDGSLNGGDSLTYPTFVAKVGGFAQTTPGVFNAHVGSPRDGLFLIVMADCSL